MPPAPKNALQLGPITLQPGGSADLNLRIALLLWGDFGTGKTTFAATAPGRKLWINVDPDGYAAIAKRKDIVVADVSQLDNETFFKQLQGENPLGLDQYLADHSDIDTVVFDSVTAVRDRALHRAVDMRAGAGKGFNPTIEVPGQTAYGARNQIVLECVSGILRVTAAHNRHVVMVAHEDAPVTNEQGIVELITMSLGGKMLQGMGWRLSEIWYFSQSDTGTKNRRIAVKPTRLRRPMKTRMFQDSTTAEFDILYDATKPDKGQEKWTLSGWYDQWRRGNGEKIPLPVNANTGVKK